MARYAVIVAAVAALLVTAFSGFLIVPLLRRLKFGQTIKEIGPTWHQGKQGTPTMGGFTFILGSCVALLVAYPLLGQTVAEMLPGGLNILLLGVITSLAFGAVGFVDDYLKVVRKQNLGLRARAKILMQALITISFLVTLHLQGRLSTYVTLPWAGGVDLGFFFYPLAFLLIVGMVNAVNLTDGIDGLATSVTLWVMCGYLVLLSMAGNFPLSLWAAAVAGGCIGFLVWNFYPAKVFMGDTGSMFLGGVVAVMGFCMGRPEMVLILGVVYLVEAASVMIQVGWFKLTKRIYGEGRRLFKMTPIHHHFEMMGWKENKIVAVFSFAAIVCAVLACIYGYITF